MFQENKARHQGVRNVRFFGKFDVLCFLETPGLRFALLPYYRRLGSIEIDERIAKIQIFVVHQEVNALNTFMKPFEASQKVWK